jgi:hypothetical protein
MHLVFAIDADCFDSCVSSSGSSQKNVGGGVHVILQFSFSGMRSYTVCWNFFQYEISYRTLEFFPVRDLIPYVGILSSMRSYTVRWNFFPGISYTLRWDFFPV